MNLYVGNINFDATEDDIRKLFEEIGIVEEVKMMYDKDNGKFKGFAFVEMPDIEEAVIAWKVLNGRFFFDRNIVVNQGSKDEERKDKKPFNKFDQNRPFQRRSYDDRKPYNSDRPRSYDSGRSRSYDNDRPRTYDNDRPRSYDNDKPRSYGNERPRTYDNDRPRSFDNDRPRSFDNDRPRSNDADKSKTFDNDNRKIEDANLDENKRPRVMRPRIKKTDE
jgi:RNA recognition motif-containing protein